MAARRARWAQRGNVDRGVVSYRLSSWTAFPRFIEEEFLDYRDFIYRGHCAAGWHLEPTLDRILRRLDRLADPSVRQNHLGTFTYATRGRRGANAPQMKSENDWWALGQHYGLATPLLDWTTSPFVAAYFAFAPETNGGDPYRAVWALDRDLVEKKSTEIQSAHKGSKRPGIVEFVRPMTDDNSRLVSQGGLFTRAPDGIRIEDWVQQNVSDSDENITLAKIEIPTGDRTLCLRSLNRMNINHLSLFPDIYGASKHSNFDLTIPNY